MSHLNPGLLSTYNSLTDKHLAGYFSNTRIRRHLQRAGLITRSGRIVPDKEYRHKLLQRAHQRHVRECLAQAIFHKVLEMERVHQMEIKRKLEEFAKRERVHKIKAERSKRYEEDIIRILSPRPPTGTRCIRKQHSGPEGEHSESSESPGSSRPNTAPGKMQRPVRLKPIHSNSTTASLRRSSPCRVLESSNENGQTFNSTMDKGFRRRLTPMEASHCISPYCLPVINNFVTPVPPAMKRKERGLKVTPSGTLRGRRLRPTTASSGADVNEDLPMLRSSVHQSGVSVNMTYFGKTVHLSHDLTDMRDEVKVFQQHCGGENLCVYKGTLHEGETFKFISRRHRGFPFSLTFFLNGLQVERLSSCCEFKHRKGSRLGGRHGHFGFSSIEGASPCYKCIIAMGLDKKPSPPPKRVKKDGGREESIIRPKKAPEMKAKRTGEDAASHSECETSQPKDEETREKEETAAVEDKVRDEYEEDFEADDEGPVEDAEAKEKKSPSSSVETQRQDKGRDASETEDDDDDIKSHSSSSSSSSDREESDAEAAKDSREDEKVENSTEVNQEESVALLDEKDETATEVESAVAKDSDIQNSAGESTEIDISDSSVPSGNEFKQSDDTSGDKEAEKTVDESKQEEEQERAKSVQEKLAEAILKESQCSSEPELSDTSTEEEEVSAAVREKSVTFTEKQETPAEEIKCKEDTGETEAVVQDQEETSDPKEQEDETKQEPHQNSDSTEDEKVKIDEEVEKAASKENTAENNKSEKTEDTSTLPVSEKEIAEDDKTSELQEDAAAKTTDAAEKGEEKEEKTAVEADTESDEAGHGAKRSEEDESLVSEPNKKSDEAALPDNAEAEAMTASETMEMKAEPSEEQEALSCEEAPVTDTEERQQGDRAAESETEVTGENSDSSVEGSGDTTVEKTVETKENDVKDEMNKDDINEEEAEEVSAVEDKKDDSQREMCDLEEEQAEKSKETDHKVEEKSEEESKEEEKQTNLDETAEGDSSEGSKVHNKDKTEEENNETKKEEKTENEETISDLSKTDINTGEKENEQSEKTQTEEETVAIEENTDEPEKTEKNESVENENVVESKEKENATDKTTEAVTNTAADKEKLDEAEDEELDQSELKAEQSEAKTNKDEESEERKVASGETVEGGEISDVAEEPEKSADSDLDKEKVKTLDEKTAESEVVSNSEAVSEVHETVTNEETLNRLEAEVEGINEDTEIGSDSSKNREIDAENGEISAIAENQTEKGESEAQPEGENDVKTGEHTEDEIKNEEITEDESIEVKEATVESEDNSEKHEEDKVEQASHTDVLENRTKEGDNKTEKQDESPINESETSGMGIKSESNPEDRKNDEKIEDENANISDPGHEHKDSDLSKKNDGPQSNVDEDVDASLDDQKLSLPPTAVDLDDTSHELDKSTDLSDSKTEKHPNADENAPAVDLSVADGENGDTEEASKPSEEGASVLLKPEAQTALRAENETENTEQSVSVAEDTPEALAKEDNTDLVTNWVTMHQASRFFETFIEPLEDLKESDTQAPKSDKEAVQSTEMPRSVSPLKTVKISENAEQQLTAKDVNESKDKTKEEAVESEIESSHSGNGEPCEKDPVKDKPQAEEETEVKGLTAESESELNKEQGGSLETDRVQEGLMQNTSEQTDISKTEVESIADIRHSETSGRPGSVSEDQTEEKTTDDGPDRNEKQTAAEAAEEMKDLLPSSETEEREEHHEHSRSPAVLSELKANELIDTDQTWEKSREVTEITDLTEDGSQEESHHKETQPKLSDESSNGDRRDMQLIQDVQHTLSKDRLSAFSVDETLFGRSSYPLLAAARTESGH